MPLVLGIIRIIYCMQLKGLNRTKAVIYFFTATLCKANFLQTIVT